MAAPVPALNQQVSVRSCACTVRFVGKTAFADGTWIGVEFPTACGRNDGTVEGVRYFECAPRHGLFVRPAQVDPLSMAAARVEKPHPEAHRDAWASMEQVLEATGPGKTIDDESVRGFARQVGRTARRYY